MLLPLKWLKDYIKVNLSPKQLAEVLMFSSFEAEGVQEDVLNLNVTPNRSDCLSILGLAREVGALTNQKVSFPQNKFREAKTAASEFLEVKVQDSKLCPQYCARIIKGVKITKSPQWLRERLESVGLRPINNVVDITNFVLFELGQPLHAFSMQKLKTKNQKSKIDIIVRKAKKGEKILALDEKVCELDDSMLVIADAERPIAVAGIIGGEEAAVDEKTKDIILESAIFEPKSVRLTSKSLGARTDSSVRFERGFDPALTEMAINRAADLIAGLCGGEVLGGIVRVGKVRSAKRTIKISVEEIKFLIGIEISEKRTISILKSLGCVVKKINKNLIVTPPSYRLDLNLPADIVEEVARLYGYNKLPENYLDGELYPPGKDNLLENIKFIRAEMLKMGFDEVYNSSFYGENVVRTFRFASSEAKASHYGTNHGHLEIENPMSPEEKYFRASLLPSLLKDIELNENNFDEIKIFEIGKVATPTFSPLIPRQIGEQGEIEGVKEELHIAAAIFSKKEKDVRKYREIKGAFEKLSETMSVKDFIIDFTQNGIYYFEFSVSSQPLLKTSFKPLPKFPGITRDLSIIVPKQVKWSQIEEIVKKEAGNLFQGVELFDIYENSLAFHINFLHPERTLKSEEVDEIISKIIKNLENLGAKIRK